MSRPRESFRRIERPSGAVELHGFWSALCQSVERRMTTWDRMKPRIYDPRLGKAVLCVPHISGDKPTALERPRGTAKKKKSKSKSVWCLSGGLPETNRHRH